MRYSKRKSIAAIAATTAICMGIFTPTQSGAQTDRTGTPAYVEEMATTVDKAAINKPGSGLEVAAVKTNAGFEAQLEDAAIKVPEDASSGVTATKTSGSGANTSVTIGIGGDEKQIGELAANGSVVYDNDTAGQTVQVTEDGIRISNVIKSAEAPDEYLHKLTLPEGAKLIKESEYQLSREDADNAKTASTQGQTANEDSSDSIIVVDKDNKVIAGFGEAWAKDANGKDVSTSYEIRDGALVQKVDHKQQGVQYPVVADPYFWIDLIKSAEWTEQEEGWTLQVTPTRWARANFGDYWAGVAGWDELYDKYKDKGRGMQTNLDGLRDQYICHQQVVAIVEPKKATWNIDEWRPDVSYAQTVNERCNPGGGNPIID